MLFFFTYWDLLYSLACDLSWRMFRVPWKRMCFLLLLSGGFYKCSFGQVGWSARPSVCLLIVCLVVLTVTGVGIAVLKCDYYKCLSSFQFCQCCFVYSGAVFSGACTFMLVASSWRIDLLLLPQPYSDVPCPGRSSRISDGTALPCREFLSQLVFSPS